MPYAYKMSITMFYNPAFYPKAVDFFNQAGLLARSSQSHPSQIASVDMT